MVVRRTDPEQLGKSLRVKLAGANSAKRTPSIDSGCPSSARRRIFTGAHLRQDEAYLRVYPHASMQAHLPRKATSLEQFILMAAHRLFHDSRKELSLDAVAFAPINEAGRRCADFLGDANTKVAFNACRIGEHAGLAAA
ncbi:MAG: hypothetical protein R3D57_05595 [Hyphomicrobiaceae bacterium]